MAVKEGNQTLLYLWFHENYPWYVKWQNLQNGDIELLASYDAGEKTFNNASLNGVWLVSESTADDNFFIIADGLGTITDCGAFYFLSPAGTYQVQPDGNFSIALHDNDEAINGDGIFTSQTEGTITFPSKAFTGTVRKVLDLSACQGNWDGTLLENNSSYTYDITVTINSAGVVTSCTGFAAPVMGKMFCEMEKVVAFIKTSDSGPYNQIQIDGSLTGNTISGIYSVDSNEHNGGTFEMTKSENIDISGYWNLYHTLNGQDGEDGPENCAIYQQEGNIEIDFCLSDSVDAIGTINGKSISISFSYIYEEEQEQQVFLTGTVIGNTMAGTWSDSEGYSGTWRMEKTQPVGNLNNIQTTTLPTNNQFDFSTGSIVASGGDFTYINFDSNGMGTISSFTSGVSGNYGNNYSDFECYLLFSTFLPGENAWFDSETVYLFDGSFDARGKWTRWFKTAEGKYAIVFIEAADESSLTMKWAYPYGNFTW